MRDHLPVGPCKVRSSAHGAEVLLTFGRFERHAGQLPVYKRNTVLTRRPLGRPEVIRAHLMAEAARPDVHEDHNLPFLSRSHRLSCLPIVHLVHDLHFQKVVARSKGTDLTSSPLLGGLAHLIRIGRLQGTACFYHLEVIRPPVTILNRPLRTTPQNIVDVPHVHLDAAGGTDARRHSGKQAIDKLLQFLAHLPLVAISPNKADATIYIKTYRPRTDDALVDVKRGNATHGKAIAPVNIRHGKRIFDDARQRGNVGHLLQRLLLGNLAQHSFVGEDEPGHAHAGLVGRWNLPTIVVDLFQDVSPGSTHSPPGLPSLPRLMIMSSGYVLQSTTQRAPQTLSKEPDLWCRGPAFPRSRISVF